MSANLQKLDTGDPRGRAVVERMILTYPEKVIVLQDSEIDRQCTVEDIACVNKTMHGEQFFCVFGDMCKKLLMLAICGFNDHNKPIVDILTISNFVATAALAFPKLWKHLCSLRGVNQYR